MFMHTVNIVRTLSEAFYGNGGEDICNVFIIQCMIKKLTNALTSITIQKAMHKS